MNVEAAAKRGSAIGVAGRYITGAHHKRVWTLISQTDG